MQQWQTRPQRTDLPTTPVQRRIESGNNNDELHRHAETHTEGGAAAKTQPQVLAFTINKKYITMKITDIIGTGKAFEPPFFTDSYGSYIFDNNHQMMLETRGFGHLRYLFSEVEIANLYPILARHICELLNREHGEGGNQRYQLLSQCCDVVRNTNLSEGIKSNLINTFMRL